MVDNGLKVEMVNDSKHLHKKGMREIYPKKNCCIEV